jgi:hypothetical protein
MKLILTQYIDHVEIVVRDATGINLHCYTFDDKKQVEAFCTGFHCGKTVANSLIQSMPMGYELKKG